MRLLKYGFVTFVVLAMMAPTVGHAASAMLMRAAASYVAAHHDKKPHPGTTHSGTVNSGRVRPDTASVSRHVRKSHSDVGKSDEAVKVLCPVLVRYVNASGMERRVESTVVKTVVKTVEGTGMVHSKTARRLLAAVPGLLNAATQAQANASKTVVNSICHNKS